TNLTSLVSQGTSPRTEKAFSGPEDLEEDILGTVGDGKTLRKIIPTLPFTFQLNRNLKPEDWKDMDQVLQLQQLLKDLFQYRMKNKRINLASHWAELGASFHTLCFKEIPFKDLMMIPKGWNPTRNGFTPFRHQQTSGQGSPVFKIPGGFQEKTRIQGKKPEIFLPKAERVRPNDPEAVGLGEGSRQESEIAVNTSRISSQSNKIITPTQNEHGVVTPESNSNSDALWLQMSQFSEQLKISFQNQKKAIRG
ncbi:hypothetical protein O181_036577, partial [Austropuccinia psidii MF-1]|nr:hypothetical protein [Austropuccinia psidii MF-1]